VRLFGRSQTKVDAVEAHRLAEAGLLLDVREPGEWAAGHAPQARHIPLCELERRLGELPAQVTIVTACRSGHRSTAARRLLATKGFEARNLTGGMHAWARAGLPVVDQRGKPGRIV
jgi:rhodanese-related sulfurtransferase